MNLSNKLRNHFATNPLSCNWFNIIEPKTIANLPPIEVAISAIPLSDRRAIKAAFKSFGIVTNEADGRRVTFPAASAGKMLYQSGTDIRAIASSFKILFEKSIRAWDEKEVPMAGHKFHFNVSAYSNYIAKFLLNDIEYFVRFTIRKTGQDSSVHASTISEVAIYRKTEGIPADSHLENPEDGHRTPFIDGKIAFFISACQWGNEDINSDHPRRSLKDILYESIANARNRRLSANASPESNASVKIAVIKHFDCQLPSVFSNDKIYFPLHCGSTPTAQKCFTDNTGDNISSYNPYLNEMTGIYWMAKHGDEIGNPDYIGLNHYRRFLQWNDAILRSDTIVATSVLFHRKVINRLCFNISQANRDMLLAKLRAHAEELGLSDFDRYLNGHLMYSANMFIMPRDHFRRYFAFIEPIIRSFINMIDTDEIPLRAAPAPEKRLYGYLLEHLTSYWLWQEKHSSRATIITTRVQNYSVS